MVNLRKITKIYSNSFVYVSHELADALVLSLPERARELVDDIDSERERSTRMYNVSVICFSLKSRPV